MVYRSTSSESQEYEYNNDNIDVNKDKNQELLKMRESIEVIRCKLDKLVGEGECFELSEEIIRTSQELDMLIRDYLVKNIEIQKKD
jgi:hypothetical protein